jgi:ABC-type nitrate/sulfonate/bicarbonate transport system substrate-binding protein
MRNISWLLLTLGLAGCGGATAPASISAGPATSAKPPASTAAPSSAASPSTTKPSGLIPLKIAYSSLSAMGLPFQLAQDTGIFAKYGISGEPIYTAGSPNSIKAVIAGDIQFASVGSSASIQANLGGATLVLVATGSPGLAFRLYARPEIKTVADLKGKRIVESQIGSDPDFALKMALPRSGLAYADAQMVHVDGNNPAQLAAYKASGAEAVILTAGSFAQAEKEFGAHMLLDIQAMNVPYNQGAMTGTRDWVQTHRDETQRFVRGYADGIKAIVNNRAQAIATMKKYTKNDDDAVANEAYDAYVQAAGGRLPYVTPDGIQSLLDLVGETNPAAKQHTPGEYVDSSFVDQLKAEGFQP